MTISNFGYFQREAQKQQNNRKTVWKICFQNNNRKKKLN